MRKTDSAFVHSSRVYAYFSVVWVFVYFMLLCSIVKAVILFLHLGLSCLAEDTEGFTKQHIGESQKKKNTSEIDGHRSLGQERQRRVSISISSWEESKTLDKRRKRLKLLT